MYAISYSSSKGYPLGICRGVLGQSPQVLPTRSENLSLDPWPSLHSSVCQEDGGGAQQKDVKRSIAIAELQSHIQPLPVAVLHRVD